MGYLWNQPVQPVFSEMGPASQESWCWMAGCCWQPPDGAGGWQDSNGKKPKRRGSEWLWLASMVPKLGLGSSSIRLDYTNPKKDRKVYEKYINPHYVFLSDVPFLSFAGLQLPGLTQYATIDICHTYAPSSLCFCVIWLDCDLSCGSKLHPRW